MKAKELAQLLLTVLDWEVCANEDGWGTSPAIVSNINVIDPRCEHGQVVLVAAPSDEKGGEV